MKTLLAALALTTAVINLTACAGLYNTIYNDNWNYSDLNKDGQLSRQEWSVYMQDRGNKTAQELGYTDKSEFDGVAFKTADKDKNGFIARAEYDRYVEEAITKSYYPAKK